ncbi:MAG: GHKL domain-containing protein [Lachnospiraceae bacterium]|nr:GHKL domain-containing protein [Lachnospiraceae bacterium]
MAEMAADISEIITFLLQGCCLQYFFGSFLESRISGRRKNAVVVSVCYCMMKIAFAYLLPAGEASAGSSYRFLLQCIMLPVFVFCFYRAAKTITIFLLTVFQALSEISFFIGYMIMSLSSPVLEFETYFFTLGYIDAVPFEWLIRFTAVMLQVLCCICWVCILYFSLRKTVSTFREKDYEMHRTELLFILTPGLVGLLLCVLLRIIMVTMENGMPSLLYDRYPVLRIVIPAILLLSLLSILYSVKLFQDMILLGRERDSRIILEQQIDNMQAHMGEMEHLYAGVRSLRHDMKNTMAVLMRLSAADDRSEKAEFTAYLAELNRSFDRLELQFRTGNAVADALLNMKYHEISRWFSGVSASDMPKDCEYGNCETFEFDAKNLLFPGNLAIQSYDIGVILGNALDNAIEACKRLVKNNPQAKPFIRLSSFQRGKFFFLEIANSFDGKLKKGSRSEFPETLKTDRQIHGIGFANMKKTAEKYGGAVDFSVEGNPGNTENMPGFAIFTLSVMMKNPVNMLQTDCVFHERREED